MRKQLQAINLTWEETSHLAKDREKMEGYFEGKSGGVMVLYGLLPGFSDS